MIGKDEERTNEKCTRIVIFGKLKTFLRTENRDSTTNLHLKFIIVKLLESCAIVKDLRLKFPFGLVMNLFQIFFLNSKKFIIAF